MPLRDQRQARFVAAVSNREQRVLTMLFGQRKSLIYVAEQYVADPERIRHVAAQALKTIREGDVFVQANPPAGYPATRATIKRFDRDVPQWVTVVYDHSRTERRVQLVRLIDPKLWLKRHDDEPALEGTQNPHGKVEKP